jgi:hypothetical protein
MNFDELD